MNVVRVTLTFLCFTLVAFSLPLYAGQQPLAVRGLLDLSDWDFKANGPVKLRGDYEFYWRQLIAPQEFSMSDSLQGKHFIPVDSYWNDATIASKKVPRLGYATYHLRVILPPDMARAGMKFLDAGSAFRVFVNGAKILEVGQVGETKAASNPDAQPQVVTFDVSTPMDLVFHVSNFHHGRAGLWEPIIFGLPRQLHDLRERQLFSDLVMVGALGLMGLYHLALFVLRRNERAPLYLALFCFLIASRTLTTEERFITRIIPNLSWEWLTSIEYAAFYLAIPVFAAMIHSLFPQEFHRIVLRTIFVLASLASAIVLFTPVLIFSRSLVPLQIFTLCCFLYGSYVLVMANRRKREGALIILLGYLVFLLSCVNDMLDADGIITTGYYSDIGLACFVFSQACLLSYRFSRAFKTIDEQNRELDTAYKGLKREMAQRLEAERENLQLQEKLARSQQMEAIGLLAGGVAHDLNNILSGTVTYPDFLLMEMPPQHRLRPALETIRAAGLKAAAIVQDLLTLARRSIINKRPTDLNKVVKSYFASPEFAHLKRNHPTLEIRTNLSPDLYPVLGSEIHLQKVLMNLVHNAAESRSHTGVIEISTTNCSLDTALSAYEEIPKGMYAMLIVCDEGEGIADEDMRKIFEPFYTKKVLGRSGTGLGMSVVWGTVHDHDGYIDIGSKPNKGSTFRIFLPITSEEPLTEEGQLAPEKYMGNGEYILVVDDDPVQCRIAESVLKKLQYKVKIANTGQEAIAMVKRQKPDLIVLDMIMEQGYDGCETFEKILEIDPGAKALIASGFSENDRVKAAQERGAGQYIRKPYTLEKIGMAIRNELAKPERVPDVPAKRILRKND